MSHVKLEITVKNKSQSYFNTINENIKNNLFTSVTILLQSFGYLYLKTLYDFFEIKIENYIDLTDVLFFLINLTAKLLISLFILYGISYLISKVIFYFINKIVFCFIEKYRNSTQKTKDRFKKLYKQKVNNKILLITLIIFFIIVFTANFYYTINHIETDFIMLFFIALIVFLYIRFLIKESIIFFICSIITICLVISLASNQYKNICDNYKIKNIEFIADSIKINTNSKEYNYIGETTSYIFIYELKTKKSLIYKKDNLKNISIKSDYNYNNDDFLLKYIKTLSN